MEVCPVCHYEELNVDSDPDEDGVFDVSCPKCGWRGEHSDFSDGPSDLAAI